MNCKEKLLEVRDLHKVYTKEGVPTKALNGITFNVLNGEYLGIMGASGSGKTTLLNCIATVIKPTAGQILLSGANISSFDGGKLAEYSRCVSILDGKRQQCSLLLSLFAHESVVGAYVIQQMADRLFSVGNRCSALLAFTQMLQVFLMGNSCVYAIDMVKLRCGWFNPSDIYKIGGSVMFRFMQKQSGLSHFGFWPSPHLWTGQLKIYHVGA